MSDLRGCKVSNFKRMERGALKGFFDLESPWGGVILKECCLFEKGDRRFIGWPSRSYQKQDGSKSYVDIVEFADNKDKYLLNDEVLPLVLEAAQHGG
jgi:hypothetical protein